MLLAGLPALRVGWVTPKAWVIAAAAAWLTTALVFVRGYRRVHARWPSVETWFATLLSPVGASRSVYALYWRSLEALHPIEAAAALCDDAELLRVARLWTYDAPDDRPRVCRAARAARPGGAAVGAAADRCRRLAAVLPALRQRLCGLRHRLRRLPGAALGAQ